MVANVRAEIHRVQELGAPEERKALLKDLVVTLRVEGNTILPTYRVPRSMVLMQERLVDPRGFEPLTF
jgi:hypothetical protein